MSDETRPIVHYLCAFIGPFGLLLTVPRIVPSDDAEDLRRYGAMTFADPDDEQLADLYDARYADCRRGSPRRRWP